MKLYRYALTVLALLTLSGCQTDAAKPAPPLETTHEQVPPPPGCVELRRRGGAC